MVHNAGIGGIVLMSKLGVGERWTGLRAGGRAALDTAVQPLTLVCELQSPNVYLEGDRETNAMRRSGSRLSLSIVMKF